MTVVIQERKGGMHITGSGGGGKGGGGSARTPVEHPDSLHNTSYAALLDVIANGEVAGPVHAGSPLRDIYLNGTPIQNEDGSLNFNRVQAEYRVGTVDQEYVAGFPAASSVTSVGVEVTNAKPFTQLLTNPDLSAVRVSIHAPQLLRMIESGGQAGDRVGVRVDYAIDLSVAGGAFQEVLRSSLDGKTVNGYTRTHRIELPATSSEWTFRVRRLTADSTNSATTDRIAVQSYAEVIDGKFRYPMSALVGIKIDAEQFQSIPTRAYHWRGKIIRVPSNYDPETRTYTGVWDGSFKRAWSNNPAWVYYDVLTSKLSGLGDRIDASMIDRYALYQIGAYCDQMVPDGQGGTEPRFAVGLLYIQGKQDALRVLNDLTSAFRGMAYWANGSVVAVADMPSDPVYTYTNANVIDGRFEYTGSDISTRKTVALVSWNDPSDFYRAKVEVVEDDEGIRRYGIRKAEVTAFACTSRGQAQRVGLYELYTSRMETGGVGFSVGLDGVIPKPGSIVKIADRNRAGRQIGGRIAHATTAVITLDREHPIKIGDRLTVNLPNGAAQTRPVAAVSGRDVTVSPAFAAAPASESAWAVDADDLSTQYARVISISEQDGIKYQISAVLHHPDKFDAVDTGVRLDPLPVSVVPPRVQTSPTNVRIEQFVTFHQGTTKTSADISWDAVENAVLYDVQWRRDNGDWVSVPRMGSRNVRLDDIFAGTYIVRVRAINALDVPSLWAYSEPTDLDGILGAPPVVTGLAATGIVFGIELKWFFPTAPNIIAKTEIRYSKTPRFDEAFLLGEFSYPTNTHTLLGLASGAELYFWVRLIDKNGIAGEWFPASDSAGVRGQASVDASDILDYINGQIGTEQFVDWVNERIEAIPDLIDDVSILGAQVADLLGGSEWDPATAYLTGDVVYSDGKMYRATQAVPAGTPVSDAAYWQYIGDFASLGDAVAGLAINVSETQAKVEEIDGEIQAVASTASSLVAQRRHDNSGDGLLTDVLNEYDSRAMIQQNSTAIADESGARAEMGRQLTAELGSAKSRITTVEQTVVDDRQAQANVNQTVQSQLGSQQAAIQQNTTAIASVETGVMSKWRLKAQANGVVAGMEIGAEDTPSYGQTSYVRFVADVFQVINLTNGVATTPFVIQNGVTVLNTAIIGDGTINSAKVGNLQSTNYVAGQQGWRLDKNGNLEFNGAVAGGGRLSINNQLIRVYDANGVMRVRLGIW